MLYHLLYSLRDDFGAFNVFRYLTFRTFMAFLTAFLFCWLLGPRFIRRLQSKQLKQNVRDDGPLSHLAKQGTPTMGGALVLMSIFFPTVLWADVQNVFVWCALFICAGFGLIGYIDDYLKVSKKNTKGLKGRTRLFAEFVLAAIVSIIIYRTSDAAHILDLPFFKGAGIDLGVWYIPFS